MKRFTLHCSALLALSLLASGYPSPVLAAAPKSLLVVTVTKGFRHSSIPTAEKVLAKLADQSQAFTVDYVRTDEEMAQKMTPSALQKYDGFVFANTTGMLPLPDQSAFLDAIKGGKPFIGMHSASDTFHKQDPPHPYIQMLGGEFAGHGAQVGVECLVQDMHHPATSHLGEAYCIQQEEIYLIKHYDRSRVRDLLVLDKHPNRKSERGHFPIAWTRAHGKGKVFYTSLGHREDVWENPLYQEHILGGIKWALGLVDDEGYRPLLNGKDLAGWKLRHADGRQSWSVKDGVLINSVAKGEHGTDLVTEAKFKNFAVKFEFMVPEGSNSGFYLRGRHEIQILDDHKRGQPAPGGNGAIYNLKPVSKFASKPAGQWQSMEATMQGNRISVVLNGEQVHDKVVCDRATGGHLDEAVKEPGPIMLQGDHGSVSFRNMRIKELK